MKVRLIRDKGTEEIDFDGDTIMPYHIPVLHIKHRKDGLDFRMLDDYQIKYTYDTEGDKLWIMGTKSADDLIE